MYKKEKSYSERFIPGKWYFLSSGGDDTGETRMFGIYRCCASSHKEVLFDFTFFAQGYIEFFTYPVLIDTIDSWPGHMNRLELM